MMSVPLGIVLGLLLASQSAIPEQDLTSLVCRANAKTSRNYGFLEKRWRGAGREPFRSAISSRPQDGFPLRDKVFSGLQTSKPMVRSITPEQSDTPGEAVEFEGQILLRSKDEMFLTWSNDINKVWLAVVDLRDRKATVVQTFRGALSVGGELETLDCR